MGYGRLRAAADRVFSNLRRTPAAASSDLFDAPPQSPLARGVIVLPDAQCSKPGAYSNPNWKLSWLDRGQTGAPPSGGPRQPFASATRHTYGYCGSAIGQQRENGMSFKSII